MSTTTGTTKPARLIARRRAARFCASKRVVDGVGNGFGGEAVAGRRGRRREIEMLDVRVDRVFQIFQRYRQRCAIGRRNGRRQSPPHRRLRDRRIVQRVEVLRHAGIQVESRVCHSDVGTFLSDQTASNVTGSSVSMVIVRVDVKFSGVVPVGPTPKAKLGGREIAVAVFRLLVRRREHNIAAEVLGRVGRIARLERNGRADDELCRFAVHHVIDDGVRRRDVVVGQRLEESSGDRDLDHRGRRQIGGGRRRERGGEPAPRRRRRGAVRAALRAFCFF